MSGLFVFNCVAINIVVTIKMFMGLFGSKNKETILILEIGSGEIAGGFFLKEKGELPMMLSAVRRDFPFRDEVSPARMKDDLFFGLDDVCNQLQKSWTGRPSRICVFLGSPWSESELRKVVFESDHDFRFTEKFAGRMLKAEVKKISEKDPSRSLMDQRTVQVSLNGYAVEKPHGKFCRSAVIEGFFSFAPSELLSQLSDRIHKTWKARISFGGEILADFAVMRDMLPDSHDFMIFSPGSETTEVLMLRKDHISGVGSFPIGERSIIRRMGQNLGKGAVESGSLFALYRSGSLDANTHEKIGVALSAAREEWQNSLKSILGILSPGRHIPPNIFFPYKGLMTEYLREGQSVEFFPEFTTGHSNFNVIITDMKTLHGFVAFATGIVRDPRIAMKAIYLNRTDHD